MDERILIVECDPEIQRDLVRVLNREGYRFYSFSGKSEAVGAFKSNPSDLIILYHKTGSCDCINLIGQFKLLNDEVEVIVISSSATIGDVIRAMRGNGAFDFILLPLQNSRYLVNPLIHALKRQQATREKTALLKTLKQRNEELMKYVAKLEADIDRLKSAG